MGKDRGEQKENHRQPDAEQTAEPCQREGVALCLLVFSCAERLPDQDADCMPERDKYHIQQIAERIRDIESGDNMQSAHRIALCQRGDSACPEKLIAENRDALAQHLCADLRRNAKRLPDACEERMRFGFCMRPDHQHAHLNESCNDGCNRRTGDAERRKAEFAVDQQIIQHDIRHDRGNACCHRLDAVTGFAQRACIGLCDAVCRQSEQHNCEILQRIVRCQHRIDLAAFAVQIQPDELRAQKPEDQHAG